MVGFNTNPDPVLQETFNDVLVDFLPQKVRKHINKYRQRQDKMGQEVRRTIMHNQLLDVKNKTNETLYTTNQRIEALQKALEKEREEKEEYMKKEKFWKIFGISIGIAGILISIISLLLPLTP